MAKTNTGAARPSSSMVVFFSRLHKYFSSLRRNWWIVLLLTSAGMGVAAWVDSQKAPSYISYGRMMVSGRIALPDGAVYSEELNNFFGTQCELMKSERVRLRAAESVVSKNPNLKASQVSLSVSPQAGTSFFILSAIGTEPNYTQAFLDACMKAYIDLKRELRIETQDTARTSITEEVLRLEKDMADGQEKILAFQKSNNVVFLEEEGNSAAKYLAQLNSQYANLKTEFQLLSTLDLDQNLERQQQNTSGTGSGDAASKQDTALGPEIDYLKAKQQVQVLKAEKERHARYMRPKHPIMLKLDSEITQQERLIALFREQSVAQLATRRELLRLQIENLETSIKEWEGKALDLTRRISEYSNLKSKVERAKALSDKLSSSIQSVDVNKSLQPDVVSPMEAASTPVVTKPGLVKNIATGGAAGAMAGLALLFLLGLLDDRVSSSVELQERFSEQVLGQVPREKSSGRLNVLNLDETHHVFAESYRNIRSALCFMSFDEPRPKTLLVTSAVPGEGKSTIAVNLAITMANGGARTLLVDADLRRGVVHEFFASSSTPGLAEVLKGQISWQNAVGETAVPNLSTLTRGRPLADTGEYFLSKVTDGLLQELYEAYDYVILDSAPVLAKDDTTSLAPKIDATLFVIRAGVSSTRMIQTALDSLYRRQVNVLGIVLNSADKASADYYYYHQYGEYHTHPATEGES